VIVSISFFFWIGTQTNLFFFARIHDREVKSLRDGGHKLPHDSVYIHVDEGVHLDEGVASKKNDIRSTSNKKNTFSGRHKGGIPGIRMAAGRVKIDTGRNIDINRHHHHANKPVAVAAGMAHRLESEENIPPVGLAFNALARVVTPVWVNDMKVEQE